MNFTLPLWLDALGAALLVLGAGFALIGAVGLARLSDFYKRLHGPTKVVTLGVGCILTASMLAMSVGTGRVSLHELLITLFVFLTAPISAQVLVKAALKLDSGARIPPAPSR
jgi:multicomponent K+:H+ antiporter subunit G